MRDEGNFAALLTAKHPDNSVGYDFHALTFEMPVYSTRVATRGRSSPRHFVPWMLLGKPRMGRQPKVRLHCWVGGRRTRLSHEVDIKHE